MLNTLLESSEFSFKSGSSGKPTAESGAEAGFLRAQTCSWNRGQCTYSPLGDRLITVGSCQKFRVTVKIFIPLKTLNEIFLNLLAYLVCLVTCYWWDKSQEAPKNKLVKNMAFGQEKCFLIRVIILFFIYSMGSKHWVCYFLNSATQQKSL